VAWRAGDGVSYDPPMARTALPVPSDRRPLGATGLSVSPFCIGITGDPKTVGAAFDLGFNFFFLSADLHWASYGALREGLQALFARTPSVRDQVVVAVVSYLTQPAFCETSFHDALEALRGLERIDISVMGAAYGSDFFARLEPYARHRRGRLPGVRATGATFHDRRTTALVLERKLVDIAFTRYNPSHPGAERDLFPRLTAEDRPLLYNFKSTTGYVSPKKCAALGLAPDKWRPEIVDYYRFALTRSELDGVLCSPSTPAEARSIADAMARGPLDDDECAYLRDLADLGSGRATLVGDGSA
jgi:hypothetical protein